MQLFPQQLQICYPWPLIRAAEEKQLASAESPKTPKMTLSLSPRDMLRTVEIPKKAKVLVETKPPGNDSEVQIFRMKWPSGFGPKVRALKTGSKVQKFPQIQK